MNYSLKEGQALSSPLREFAGKLAPHCPSVAETARVLDSILQFPAHYTYQEATVEGENGPLYPLNEWIWNNRTARGFNIPSLGVVRFTTMLGTEPLLRVTQNDPMILQTSFSVENTNTVKPDMKILWNEHDEKGDHVIAHTRELSYSEDSNAVLLTLQMEDLLLPRNRREYEMSQGMLKTMSKLRRRHISPSKIEEIGPKGVIGYIIPRSNAA